MVWKGGHSQYILSLTIACRTTGYIFAPLSWEMPNAYRDKTIAFHLEIHTIGVDFRTGNWSSLAKAWISAVPVSDMGGWEIS